MGKVTQSHFTLFWRALNAQLALVGLADADVDEAMLYYTLRFNSQRRITHEPTDA